MSKTFNEIYGSIDLCEECFQQKVNSHLNHTILRFPDMYDKYEKYILDYIEKVEITENNNFPNRTLFTLMNLILSSYKDYPCFTIYKNLNNLLTYLKTKKYGRELNLDREQKMEILFKINQIKKLKAFLSNQQNKINRIESIIIDSQNFYDLKPLILN